MVSGKWVVATDETEACAMATKDLRSETGRVVLVQRHYSESVSRTYQWAIDLEQIQYLP